MEDHLVKMLWPPLGAPNIKEEERINLSSFVGGDPNPFVDVYRYPLHDIEVTKEKIFFSKSRYPDLSKDVQKRIHNDIWLVCREQGYDVKKNGFATEKNRTPRLTFLCKEKQCKFRFQINYEKGMWYMRRYDSGTFRHNHNPTVVIGSAPIWFPYPEVNLKPDEQSLPSKISSMDSGKRSETLNMMSKSSQSMTTSLDEDAQIESTLKQDELSLPSKFSSMDSGKRSETMGMISKSSQSITTSLDEDAKSESALKPDELSMDTGKRSETSLEQSIIRTLSRMPTEPPSVKSDELSSAKRSETMSMRSNSSQSMSTSLDEDYQSVIRTLSKMKSEPSSVKSDELSQSMSTSLDEDYQSVIRTLSMMSVEPSSVKSDELSSLFKNEFLRVSKESMTPSLRRLMNTEQFSMTSIMKGNDILKNTKRADSAPSAIPRTLASINLKSCESSPLSSLTGPSSLMSSATFAGPSSGMSSVIGTARIGVVLPSRESKRFRTVSLSRNARVMAVRAHLIRIFYPSYNVSMFQINASTLVWTRMGQALVGEANESAFEESVTLNGDGTIVAIGSVRIDGGGRCGGRVRVYEYNVNTERWVQLGSCIDIEQRGNYCGISTSLNDSGDILLVGMWGSIVSVRAFRFDRKTSLWEQLGQTIPGEDFFINCSVSLSSSGTIIAVGAPGLRMGVGRVYTYKYNSLSSLWAPMGPPINAAHPKYSFGSSVSFDRSGLVLAVGGTCSRSRHDRRVVADDSARKFTSARVFAYDSATMTWIQRGQTLQSQLFGIYFSGCFSGSMFLSEDGNVLAVVHHQPVSLSEDRKLLAVRSGQVRSGQVIVFLYDTDTDKWNQVGEGWNCGAAGKAFGRSVSISGDETVIGHGAPLLPSLRFPRLCERIVSPLVPDASSTECETLEVPLNIWSQQLLGRRGEQSVSPSKPMIFVLENGDFKCY